MSISERSWFRALSWLLLAAYLAIIFYLSSQPSLPVPPLFPNQDKLFHFLEYLGLAFVITNCIPREFTLRRRFWIAFSLTAAYGLTDEFHQSLVPGRDCTIADWLADAAGGWVGAWLFLKVESLLRRWRR